MKPKTQGVSPKVYVDAAVSILGFVLAKYAVDLDPVLAAAIGKGLGTLGGVIAGPGNVKAAE